MTHQPSSYRAPPAQSAIAHRPSAIRHALFAGLAVALLTVARAAPLTLDDAIRLALQRNYALKVSAFGPDIARANVLTAYGAFDPEFTFRRSYREGQVQVSTVPLITSVTQTDDYALSFGGLAP